MNNIKDYISDKTTKVNKNEWLDLKIQFANEKEGNMDKIDNVHCDKCRNRGYVTIKKYVEIYDEYVEAIKDCECMKKRKLIRNALNSGLGDYLNKSIDEYKTTEQWQENCKKKAISYINSNNSDWFIMCGQSGSGKTLLCSIIANSLIMKNHLVQYITWTDFISKLKRDVMGDNANVVSEYLNELKNAEILFIDELLKKYNETDLKYIIEIINYRYTNNLKTIITSERDIQELLDIDEAVFGRIIEKSRENILYIPKDRKKNYRLKNINSI